MPINISNNNQGYSAKDFLTNVAGAAAGGTAYLVTDRIIKRTTQPYLGMLTRENLAQTEQSVIKKALTSVLNLPSLKNTNIQIIDFAQLPKIPGPQSKWAYILNKAKPETINRNGYSKEVLLLEKQVDSVLKRMVPKWQRHIKGLAEYNQKVKRYILQEGMTAMALPGRNIIFANMTKINAAVFHEIGHLLDPKTNIRSIKMKKPLPFFILGSLLMPKLDTGENGEKKLNKGINFLRNCTPILAAAAWLPIIGTEGMASEKGLNLAKPFLDDKNLNIIKKAYKYAGATYVIPALATGLGLWAGLKIKDWFTAHKKQIYTKIHDKI